MTQENPNVFREHVLSDDCWCNPTRAEWSEELQRWIATSVKPANEVPSSST